jgi:hypothetical protein
MIKLARTRLDEIEAELSAPQSLDGVASRISLTAG